MNQDEIWKIWGNKMWTDTGKLRILREKIDYYDNIESPAGPENIHLVFSDGSFIIIEWHSKEVDLRDIKSEVQLAKLTNKSKSCDFFVLIKKMLESWAEGKIYRDGDLPLGN